MSLSRCTPYNTYVFLYISVCYLSCWHLILCCHYSIEACACACDLRFLSGIAAWSGLSCRHHTERLEKVCVTLGVKAVFKPQRTISQMLVQVKEKIPTERKKEVVYEVACKDCDQKYIGETKRTMKKWLTEHKYAVRRGDEKNGIAVHANKFNHSIDWESAGVLLIPLTRSLLYREVPSLNQVR